MQKLLYKVHRWAGIFLAIFMCTWFVSGAVIYLGPSTIPARLDQLTHLPTLHIEDQWPDLESALRRQENPGEASPVAARLVRLGALPAWIVEDAKGGRRAVDARSGQALTIDQALASTIASQWMSHDPELRGKTPELAHRGMIAEHSALRNVKALGPFHRLEQVDSDREVLVSSRTGEVVRDSTRLSRAAYWAGNWLHLLRPIDELGHKDLRRDTLMWLAFFAWAACLTGLIIGWQRWRPRFGRQPLYRGGRTHPYRDVWNTWHFWAGLIGGTAALLWAFSGWFNGNPFQMFSPAAPERAELARYLGSGQALGTLMRQPAARKVPEQTVELAWQRIGHGATWIASDTQGTRWPLRAEGVTSGITEATIVRALQDMRGPSGPAANLQVKVQADYDSSYYARKGQSLLDRPLPILRVDAADPSGTRYYVDPIDGRLVLRSDTSRRIYRWVWSALHHWDFGWLAQGLPRHAWMLLLIGLGIVLSGTSVVLGVQRLRRLALRHFDQRARSVASPADGKEATAVPVTARRSEA